MCLPPGCEMNPTPWQICAILAGQRAEDGFLREGLLGLGFRAQWFRVQDLGLGFGGLGV